MTPKQIEIVARARKRQAQAMQAAEAEKVQIAQQAGQPTALAQSLAQNPAARQQYAQRMANEAFGTPSEVPLMGLLGGGPISPEMMAGEVDLVANPEAEALETAYFPDFLTPGVAAARSALKAAPKTQAWRQLVEPYQGRSAQIAKEFRGTDKSLWGTYSFRNSKAEREMINVLRDVKGVNPGRNARDNLNAVIDEISRTAGSLQTRLAHSGSKVTRRELEERLRRNLSRFKDTPEGRPLRGKDVKVDDYINDVLYYFDQQPSNAVGLWEARKNIDNLFRDLNGGRRAALALNATKDNLIPSADEVAWNRARKVMLDMLEERAPGAKSQMKRMSILYDARQTFAEKAPDIRETIIQRTKQQIPILRDKSLSLKPRNWRQ